MIHRSAQWIFLHYTRTFVCNQPACFIWKLEWNLQRIVRHFFEQNKPVAAICHAALVLNTVRDLMVGRTYSAYTACKPDVEMCGAVYPESTVHVDGNLVSAHAWPDLPSFMREFVKLVNESPNLELK